MFQIEIPIPNLLLVFFGTLLFCTGISTIYNELYEHKEKK